MSIQLNRKTKETDIRLQLDVDGNRQVSVRTGLAFFDHMLEQLAFHAGWNLTIDATGDIDVDDHHMIEDVAIVIGDALNQVRQARPGLARYGQRLLPMDETLVLCAVDLSGRPAAVIDLPFKRDAIANITTEMWPHFFKTLAIRGQFALHIKTEYFENHHHLIEAAFKALARALREALSVQTSEVTSTKGVL